MPAPGVVHRHARAFVGFAAFVFGCSSRMAPTDANGTDGETGATADAVVDAAESAADVAPLDVGSDGPLDADAAAPVDVTDAVDAADGSITPCLSGFHGPSLDIDTLAGLHWGTTATVTEAANNVAVVNTAAETMRPMDGALYSAHGGVLMIGAPMGGTSGHLIHSGVAGSQHGLNHWCLSNVTFRLMPQQPMFAEGTSPSVLIDVANAAAPEFEFTLDGNAANQYQIDVNRDAGAQSNRAGFYGTGLGLRECGPTRFAVTIQNIRGVTAHMGATTVIQPGSDGGMTATVDSDEVFHMQQLQSLGGDTGWIHSETNDGSDTGANHTTDTRASGPVWQYVQEPGGRGTAPVSAVLLTSINVRHGAGTFCGGRLQILNGSLFDGCEHDINLEAGTPTMAINHETYQVTIGEPGAPPGSIVTRNASIIGIQANNNSANNVPIHQVDVYGWDSTNDLRAMEIDGTPPGNAFNVHDGIVHSPRAYCVYFSDPTDETELDLIGLCRVHLGSAALYNLSNVTIGSGSWDTSL